MTFDLSPELPEEQKYEEPKRFVHELSPDGELGKVIDHLTPEETEEFHRLRIAQTKVNEGGMGVVKQRHGGMVLMEATIAEARANLHG